MFVKTSKWASVDIQLFWHHLGTYFQSLCSKNLRSKLHCSICTLWLVPKGVQENRTEVLENKVDRMWVRNTCEVIHQWREKAVLLFVPEKFDFRCDLWQYVEHYTLQQAHITVLLIMQLTAKTQLILQDVIHMSITKWTVVVLCHTEQHAMHGLLQ